jgi:hypothetical protein
MKARILTALAVFSLCFTIGAFADEAKTMDKAAMDQMMAKWMAFATPGEAHKTMANMVGTWDGAITDYSSGTPTQSKGVSTMTSIMDGRYIQESVEGDFNGMKFHGMGTYGYDNLQKVYVTSWVDNMGTGIMNSTGTSNDGGKTINYTGTSSDPISGKVQTYRSVIHVIDNDHTHFEMYGPGMDGKEVKAMEISYTRRK